MGGEKGAKTVCKWERGEHRSENDEQQFDDETNRGIECKVEEYRTCSASYFRWSSPHSSARMAAAEAYEN